MPPNQECEPQGARSTGHRAPIPWGSVAASLPVFPNLSVTTRHRRVSWNWDTIADMLSEFRATNFKSRPASVDTPTNGEQTVTAVQYQRQIPRILISQRKNEPKAKSDHPPQRPTTGRHLRAARRSVSGWGCKSCTTPHCDPTRFVGQRAGAATSGPKVRASASEPSGTGRCAPAEIEIEGSHDRLCPAPS